MKEEAVIPHYYQACESLYEDWSGRYSGGYHFGFPKRIRDLFSRSLMARNLSDLVINSLDLSSQNLSVLDAGCGVGDVSRRIIERYPNQNLQVTAITISENQKHIGVKKNEQKGITNLRIDCGNFQHMPYPDASFDRIFFIDSFCYGDHEAKAETLKECSRLLRPGGRLVISDAFLQKSENEFSWIHKKISAIVRNSMEVSHWAVERKVEDTAQNVGLHCVQKIDKTYAISPSVLQVTFFLLPFEYIRAIFGKSNHERLFTYWAVGIFSPWLGTYKGFKYKVLAFKKDAKKPEYR